MPRLVRVRLERLQPCENGGGSRELLVRPEQARRRVALRPMALHVFIRADASFNEILLTSQSRRAAVGSVARRWGRELPLGEKRAANHEQQQEDREQPRAITTV